MSVRIKLQLSFAVFILALVALGGWSAFRFRQLGDVAHLIISENYDSVEAAQNMKESLERMDSAAVFLLLNQRDRAVAQAAQHRKLFDHAYGIAASNITEPGEAEIIGNLKRDRDIYYEAFDAFLASATPSNSTYFTTLEPLFNKLRADCESLLQVNQRAMEAKARNTSSIANRWFRWTWIIALILLAVSLLCAGIISERIVGPLKSLRDATAQIAAGELAVQAPVESQDEIGTLASEFNRMSMSLAELRRSDRGKLLVAQQMAEAAIDSLYDPVIVTDEKGLVTRLNPAAERIFGVKAASLGKPIAETTNDSRIALAVSEALNWQRPVVGEGIASAIPITLNGSEQSYSMRTTPMRDQFDKLLGTVVMLENVTRLKEVDRLKSEFVANASQQLDEPVRELEMSLHCLLSEVAGELTDTQRDLLYNCRSQVERWGRIRDDLLELTSIESGEFSPRLSTLSLQEWLATTLNAVRPEIEASELSLRLEPTGPVPSVLADPESLKKVVIQLLENSRRNTPRGGEIKVTAAATDDYVTVAVADTGKGIPAEFLPKLFNRFGRVPGMQSGGSGLGLAIARKIIEAHGGQVSVQSEVGRGTVVSFTLLKAEDRTASSRHLLGSELERLTAAPLEKVNKELLKVRPGGILVTARDFSSLHYLRRALAEVDSSEQDVIVMTVRVSSRESHQPELSEKSLTDAEHLLFTRALDLAGKLGKKIRLLIVPGSDAFQTTVETAIRLECSTLVAGVSSRMPPQQQARRIGEQWERVHLTGKRKLRILRLISIDGTESVFEMGAHRPIIAHEDIELTHRLWLELAKDRENLHHNEVISIALQDLAEKLQKGEHLELTDQLRAIRKGR